MPRYLKQNGEKVPNVVIENTWVVIPIESNMDTTPIHTETYLIPTRVVDYIELLESNIKGELPKLHKV